MVGYSRFLGYFAKPDVIITFGIFLKNTYKNNLIFNALSFSHVPYSVGQRTVEMGHVVVQLFSGYLL